MSQLDLTIRDARAVRAQARAFAVAGALAGHALQASSVQPRVASGVTHARVARPANARKPGFVTGRFG